MYPLLILREEFLCLLILLFLTFISKKYRMGTDGRVFNRLLFFAHIHVVMDAATVWTVNHMNTVPSVLNDFCHALFYISAMCFAGQILLYVLNFFRHREIAKTSYLIGGSILAYSILLPLMLQIQYVPAGGEPGTAGFQGTWASTGSAVILAFAFCMVCFATALWQILRRWNQIGNHIRYTLAPLLVLLLISGFLQMFRQDLLLTGGTVTVAAVGFFFSLENPNAVLERKVLMDATRGLKTRADYDRDIEAYDREFRGNRDNSFTMVLVGIANIKFINGMFGHLEGDECISRIAVLLANNLRSAEGVYRMSGDEFLAIYRGENEKIVIRDMEKARGAVRKTHEQNGYQPELAFGYAVSGQDYDSLRNVMRVADYMMYRSKTEKKLEAAVQNAARGTQINLTGLTDRVFDAMCLTSEQFYPFITNMDTLVTRVAPGLAEFCGLNTEFSDHFLDLWTPRVHPEDRKEFLEDITSALQGRKQYHYCRYRAMNRNGEYCMITCRGGLYHGRDDEPDIFAGYMVNMGAPETVDAATGLKNGLALAETVEKLLADGTDTVLSQLEIDNRNRLQMLYGSEVYAMLLRSMADLLYRMICEQNKGLVFSENGERFFFLLGSTAESRAQELFRQIRGKCLSGLNAGEELIPVDLSGGAVRLPAENLRDAETLRLAVLYAAEEARFNPKKQLIFYQSILHRDQQDNRGLLKAVHSDCVTERKHFYLRYQPIVDLKTRKLCGAEALLRWRSPDLGEVSPGQFISFLETDPGYEALGYDILQTAVREAVRISRFVPDFRISVNITALQLMEDDFIPRVLGILKEEGLPPERLILELTERCKEMAFDLLKDTVAELRKTGILVALDDMGTGFSSLDLLLHLPVNEVKLDMNFTRSLEGSPRSIRYARTLCQAAEAGDMEICFEGIETGETAEFLTGFGSVMGQGYFFDKPLLAEEFEQKYCGKT